MTHIHNILHQFVTSILKLRRTHRQTKIHACFMQYSWCAGT